MVNIHHSHQRALYTGKRPARPSIRPELHRNFSSSTIAVVQAAKRRFASETEDLPADDCDMAMSFHQFCTTCEKQITAPNNIMLYCSESCRRRDATSVPSMPPFQALTEYESFTGRPVLSRRRTAAAGFFGSIPPVLHTGKADMDPTEWKPDEIAAAAPGITPEMPCPQSEAYFYLSQFHRSGDNLLKTRRLKSSVGSNAQSCLTSGASGNCSSDSSFANSPAQSVRSPSVMMSNTAPSSTCEEAPAAETAELSGSLYVKKPILAHEDVAGSISRLFTQIA